MKDMTSGVGTFALLALMLAALGAAESESGWRFPLDKALFYRYQLSDEVSWRSSGDQLGYRSGMTWIFALKATASDGATATVQATIIRIQASLDGPAAEVRVDSNDAGSTSDPVYGPLIALAGSTLTLTVEQATGRVSAVSGGDEVIAQINKRHPASVPSDPPPLAAAARQLYSSEALAAWWTQVLAQPAKEIQPVPLAPPLSGNLQRTWSGDRYTLSLPESVHALAITLVEGTNAVNGSLTAVAGSGQVRMDQGVLAKAAGELTYALFLTALTQAVEQQHKQLWSLEPWAVVPDKEPAKSSPRK